MKISSKVIGWVLAFIGFPIGGLLAGVVIGSLDTAVEGLIGGGLAGIAVGVAQTLALRRWLNVDWMWAGATTIGLAVGLSLSVLIMGAATTVETTVVRGVITGLVLGMAQGWVFRRVMRRAIVWAILVTVLYPAAWFITAQVIQASLGEGFVVFGSSGALFFQTATGIGLWLMERER